ncbi:MAG: ferrochelatase [Chloroflexi bacterium]|nr:ferrochelatase [Chloroflexota bacterium]
MQANYDALLIVSFGGPEGMDEVMPFLENVLRGRNVPRERMLDVAHHYELFGGVSPINGQNRALIAALHEELDAHDLKLPIYWGNRNWQPYLADTLRQMRDDGVRHALAFFTSAYSSYSGCRQYREDIQRAQTEVGSGAPAIDKLRVFYNHPGFITANVERVCAAFEQIPAERRDEAKLIFTAHSIPLGMAEHSDYVAQLEETSRLVAAGAGHPEWQLAYQSRSGSPRQPWLEPDILAVLRETQAQGARDIVVMPVGFISDHMEVLYDLDTEARQLSSELGLNMIRAGTAGTHPAFITMLRELIVERMDGGEKRAVGMFGANHDVCPVDCCLAG